MRLHCYHHETLWAKLMEANIFIYFMFLQQVEQEFTKVKLQTFAFIKRKRPLFKYWLEGEGAEGRRRRKGGRVWKEGGREKGEGRRGADQNRTRPG